MKDYQVISVSDSQVTAARVYIPCKHGPDICTAQVMYDERASSSPSKERGMWRIGFDVWSDRLDVAVEIAAHYAREMHRWRQSRDEHRITDKASPREQLGELLNRQKTDEQADLQDKGDRWVSDEEIETAMRGN